MVTPGGWVAFQPFLNDGRHNVVSHLLELLAGSLVLAALLPIGDGAAGVIEGVDRPAHGRAGQGAAGAGPRHLSNAVQQRLALCLVLT